jgi:hypothetical protein
MRLPVLFSTLPVLGVAWAVSSSAQCTGNPNNDDRVLNYFGHLVPVVNDTILHKLGGPDIGADVNQHPLCALQGHYLIAFLSYSLGSFSPSFQRLSIRAGQHTGSAMLLSFITSGSISLLSLAAKQAMSARSWMTQFTPSLGLNMFRTSLETSSPEDSQKPSMTAT